MRGGLPYELMIGRRYLRSTGNRFLSFISLISMLGVAIGVAVLIVVLSVMNGFERELRSRILRVTSHATVSAFGAGMADWPAARHLELSGKLCTEDDAVGSRSQRAHCAGTEPLANRRHLALQLRQHTPHAGRGRSRADLVGD